MILRKKKGRFHHSDLRRSLIEAVVDLVAREGAASVNMRVLAAKLGVTHAAPYRHFGSKQEILSAVAEEGFLKLKQQIEAALAPLTDPLERWEEIGEIYLRFALTHTGYFRLMYGAELSNRRLFPGLDALASELFQMLVDTIARAQRAGEVRSGDPREMATISWSLMHGLTDLLLNKQIYTQGSVEARALSAAHSATKVLLSGVSARAPKKGKRKRPA